MKNKTFVFDTNFICSFLNIDDVNHEKALKKLAYIAPEDTVFVTYTVLLELATQDIIKFETILEFMRRFEIKEISFFESDYIAINELKINEKSSLKPIDLSIYYATVKLDAQLLTFDQKLSKTLGKVKKQSLR